MPSPLKSNFYNRPADLVAFDLIGKRLVRESIDGIRSGIIIETEAYLSENDEACHASRGMTRRNALMFGRPGLLYVYTIHNRFCLNCVTEAEGIPSAVLIRAVEIGSGEELISKHRPRSTVRDLVRGPARLCEGFSIQLDFNGHDLTQGEKIWIESSTVKRKFSVGRSSRIGISKAKDLDLRFYFLGSKKLSGPSSLSL